MKPLPTIRREIETRVGNHPHYHPEHETVIWGCDNPGDGVWGIYTFVPKSQRNWPPHKRQPRLRYIQIPGDLDLDDAPPYPPQYIGRIGQSGWNYVRQVVTYLSFEFDGQDHAKGITADDMADVRKWLESRPEIQANTSTNGGGLHVRLHVEPIPARTRDEFLKIRRTLVQDYIEQYAPFPFNWIDMGGRGNLWIWRAS